MKSSYINTMQRLFAGAYILLIISTIAQIKSNTLLSDAIFAVRAGALILILLIWITNTSQHLRAEKYSFIFFVVFAPYALTEARMAYLDVLIILIMASTIRKSQDSAHFFISLANISLAIALTIAILAWTSILPQIIFEWKDRVKYSMGYTNPNTFFYYIFSSAFVFFVFRQKIAFLFCGVLIITLYPTVGSRTFLIAYILLFATWINPRIFQKPPIMMGLWLWLTLAIVFGFATALYPLQLSIALSSLTGIDFNELTSSRFEVINDTANRSLIELIIGGKQNYGDSLYVYILNDFGLIWIPLFFFIIYKSIKSLTKKQDPTTLVLACIYFTIGLAEVPFDGSSLVALLFILSILYNTNQQKSSVQQTPLRA